MDAERIYIPIATEKIVALSRVSGERLWTRDIESSWPPLVIGDTLYVAASDEIHALDPATGAQKWRVPFSRAMAAPLALAPNLVIGSFDMGLVVAFATDDGHPVWMRELASRARFAPVTDTVRAFFVLDDSRTVALSLADGRVAWEQKLEGMLNQPAYAGNRVFVGSDRNALYAFDNESGRLGWRWKTGGDVIGTSADAKGGAYYASLDNVLRAVNRGNGNQRWIKEIPTRPVLPPQVFGDGMTYEEIVVVTGVTSEIDAYAASNGMAAGAYTPPPDSALQGAPLIDPVLRPYRVAMVVITRDGRVIGLKPSAMLLPEPTNAPFTTELPGRRLERERITPPATR